MSNDKNPEVVGCDASIMKNVWAIREREYGQKLQQEEDRMEKSALPSINKDWAGRLAARQGGFKRVERKVKPADNQIDNDNVWKSKLPDAPSTLPRGKGSAPLGRPGGQSRGFSTPTSNYKDKKGQDKSFKRLQSLMFITQTQPCGMVWGKSWKYNKSLPLPVEGERSNWGQCWMFATQQPYSEEGQPWLNGPNLLDPHNLHLWKKPDSKVLESQELDLSLPIEEWQMSWRKADKNKKKEDAGNGENGAKSGFFTMLVETQHRNECLCSSEWSESWRATKPASQQDDFNDPNDGLMNESTAKKQDKDREMSSKWEECWRLVNHHGCNKAKLPQVKKSPNPEWANAWRANMVVVNNQKSSDPSLTQDHSDNYDDHSQQRESHLHKFMLVSCEQKHRDQYLQLYNEFQALSEWTKSWQVTKNNSKPCEEIEKVLKASPPRLETALEAKKVENNSKGHHSTSEKLDSRYEQLKHNVIYHPKREFTQSQLLHLKYLENVLSASEWRDSWKTLKHRMRMERRRMRPDPLRSFRVSERGRDMNPTASEWKDSWKFNCQTLHQEPETWQQHWPTTPQIRVDRARDQNHFAPVELPKNGPTGERSWAESWRSMRHQRQSEPGHGMAQTRQARSSAASHHPDNSQAQRRYARPCSDWQDAWMVSETEFHHDRPSFTQWRAAWRSSFFHTEHMTEQVPREHEVDVLMEIQPPREKISLQRAKAKMSRSFDNQMFRERYPEKQWNASWKAGSLLNNQPSHYGSSGTPGKSISNTQQHHTTENGHGSKWGKSFRIANPMPHMEQPWVESSPNSCHYAVMWSRGKNIHNNINTNFSKNPAILKVWGSSHRFLQGVSAQIKAKTTSMEPIDPWVIIKNKMKTRMHLYSNIEKEKQSEKKSAGGHLLGKTQPRPKRGSAPVKNLKMQDKTADKFFEEWAESWKFSVPPGGLKKKMPVKSLSGWNESWKFLIPPYPPTNGHKVK
ncbi:uncharacterized protein LOC119478712 [Sebastes umbrosus]|uniref:uncharacterized protein LOC119478712 n=1 Tax=Sebastes umbrosus TaxID=72105 RepID=UPI00189F9D46|nr:uncharacterized protein LOC119478712 [Sebastes umbrosus]